MIVRMTELAEQTDYVPFNALPILAFGHDRNASIESTQQADKEMHRMRKKQSVRSKETVANARTFVQLTGFNARRSLD